MKAPLFFLLTSLSFSVSAEIAVQTSPEPPAKNVQVSFVVPDADALGYQWRNTPALGRRDLGQIFMPETAFTLERITLQLQSGSGVGTKEAPFRLLIFEIDATSRKISRELAAFDGTLPAAVSKANTFLTFDLGGRKVDLEARVSYGFLLIFEDPLDSRALSLQSQNENAPKPSTHRVESMDGKILSPSKSSMEFYLEGTAR